jgi:hypothetical protein
VCLTSKQLAKGNDGIDHAQRDAAVDELKQDFHKSGEINVLETVVRRWRKGTASTGAVFIKAATSLL